MAQTKLMNPAILLKLSAASPAACLPRHEVSSLSLRDAQLLAWLALEGPTLRVRLAALLWPDSDADAARNSLRQRLFKLHKQIGAQLVIGSSTLALADGVEHDLADSDSVLGDTAADNSEFGHWLAQQRARRRDRMRRSLVELAEMAERVLDFADALGHAQELLALEPSSEDAHRRVIRLHYLGGDRAAALLAFDRCERVLKDEVGTSPSAETLALLTSIEAQRNEPALHPRVLPVGLRRPPRVIGRERELDALVNAWSAGSPFLATGDAGIGKTRLLDSLARHWPGTLLVPARPGDINVPHVLIGRLVDSMCERQPACAGAACVQALRELVRASPEPLQHARSRPSVRHGGPPLRELLALGLAAPTSLALLFDDLQFADEASLALLGEVLASPALEALRWGWASRTHGEYALPRIESLRRRSELRHIALQPLLLADITELVGTLQLGGGDAAALAVALRQRVGGNPMFVLETLRRMVDQGRPLHAEHVGAPQTVHDLVEARLADLPAGQRLLMHVAAIAGTDFDVALAEAVSGRDALELTDDWRALERLALFDQHGIAHDLYAEAALADLPAAIARTLQARVATRLEAGTHDPARIAAHWLAAADDRRALPHLLSAARSAWQAAAAGATLSFYRQAAEIALANGEPDQAFDHWFDAADAMAEIGSPAMLQRCADGLLPLAHSPRQQVRLRLVLGVLQYAVGQTDAALGAMRDLLIDAVAVGDLRAEAECRIAIAMRARAKSDFDEVVQQVAAAERLLREAGDARRALAASVRISTVMGLRGQPRLAIAEHQRLLPLLEGVGDQPALAVLCSNTGLQHIFCGDTANGLRETERALLVTQRVSISAPELQAILRRVTQSLCWAGRFDLALPASQALVSRLAGQGNFPACADVQGMLYLQLGRPDLAHPHLAARLACPREGRGELLYKAWLRASHACLSMTPPAAADWPSYALRSGELVLASQWGLLSGLVETAPWPAAEIALLADRCDALGVVLFGLPLRALQARRMLEAGDHDQGAALLTGLEAAVADRDLVASTPWTTLFLAQALRRAGADGAAARIARHGKSWVERVARETLPAEFRDSFLHRNPINRELLALAARLSP
jgi:DNA-binding SARP family transcriptional activator